MGRSLQKSRRKVFSGPSQTPPDWAKNRGLSPLNLTDFADFPQKSIAVDLGGYKMGP
jgi:hypothetical protein